MGAVTKIEWADGTVNFWIGCTKVSAACDHCYAETLSKRYGWAEWGPRQARMPVKGAMRTAHQLELRAVREGRRLRVFTNSLSDFFDNEARQSLRSDAWSVIRVARQLDWLILTKRPQNFARMLPSDWGAGWPNVWLGTTVENQTEAARRIPHLLAVPAAVRFLSCEPLLGPVNLRAVAHRDDGDTCTIDALRGEWFYPGCGSVASQMFRGKPRIDWVICGGESGPGGRPMHPDWARSLRDQCAAAGVPFFFKQLGEWAPHRPRAGGDLGGDVRAGRVRIVHPAGQTDVEVSESTGGYSTVPGSRYMERVGKARAGRLLDGREHNDVPVPALREVA